MNSDKTRDALTGNNVVAMIADITTPDAVVTNFLHAYKYASIPVNMVIPGAASKPAIAIDGPIASGDTFVEMIEKAVQ